MTYNQLTTESFIEKARAIHGDKYDYSKVDYINNHTKVTISCPVHGDYTVTPMKHLAGHECPECAKINRALHKKYSTQEFIDKAKTIHGGKYDYSKVEYAKSSVKVCIICPEHGEFWTTPNNHLRGHGCSKCQYTNLRKLFAAQREEFIEKAKIVHGDKYDYSKVDYINENKKICLICPTHGEFWVTPKNHLKGNGCTKCSESKLEREISHFLDDNGVSYRYQASRNELPFMGRQRLDFYLPDYNVAIECQGEQHFKPVDFAGRGEKWAESHLNTTIKKDTEKLNKCLNNNIKMIYYSDLHIDYPYPVFENKEELLKEIRGTNG